ncbi:hypothetical protein UPYG_G00177460 [Umbra pygmaea]|uniref:Uncharacterized protein n=1 Tax=Umbra pygmaea TaxID=75934 RepID=A0ABD0WPY5_UMBPY
MPYSCRTRTIERLLPTDPLHVARKTLGLTKGVFTPLSCNVASGHYYVDDILKVEIETLPESLDELKTIL